MEDPFKLFRKGLSIQGEGLHWKLSRTEGHRCTFIDSTDEVGMNIPSHLFDGVRERGDFARQKEIALKKQAEEAAHIAGVWHNLLEYMTRGWSMHILNLLDGERILFKQLQSGDNGLVSCLEEIARRAGEGAESARKRFPTLFEHACKEAGFEINPESRHPRYYFEGKFFTLEINDQKQSARLSDHEGRLEEFPADVEAIVEALGREHKRVFGRKFDGKAFLKKLRGQYLAIVKKEEQEDGAAVPIRQITRRLGKNEKGFRTDEFLIDLSRLVQRGPLEVDSRRLDLQQTKDTNQGMLLQGTDIRGYIGFVIFRKVRP